MEFFRPEYWSWKPFPSPGDHPTLGIKPRSPIFQVDSLPAEPQGKPKNTGVGNDRLLLEAVCYTGICDLQRRGFPSGVRGEV